MPMQMVDSKEQELTPEDIIGIAAMNGDTAVMGGKAVEAINAELQMPNTLFIRQGNTLFILHKSAPGIGWFRGINADTAKNYVENGTEFIAACYKLGFDTVATKFTDPSLLNLFRAISRNPPNEGMGYDVKKTNRGEFFVTVKTGPKRGG
jgi:hypothetical protein